MTPSPRKSKSAATLPTEDGLANGETSLERVQVVLRVRPPTENSPSCLTIENGDGGDMVTITGAPNAHQLTGLKRTFNVTHAFNGDSTQEDVFNYVGKRSMDSVMKGYGACIFAYGQTGSGKTYTMTGTRTDPGLVARMLKDLFERLDAEYEDFSVTCEYLEIYMEKVRDLFNPARQKNPWDVPGPKVNIRYNGKEVFIENNKVLTLGSEQLKIYDGCVGSVSRAEFLCEKLLQEIDAAGCHRVIRSHALNAESSRSHAVLILKVRARRSHQEIAPSLTLVDLAGSENILKADVSGIGREETKSINKSLLALTRCIEALALETRVPYRDSVLTKLLTSVLDGRSCCTLVAAVRADHEKQSFETLKFTELALKIKVTPKQNSSEGLDAVREKEVSLLTEIEALRQELTSLKRQGHSSSEALREVISEKEARLKHKEEALANIRQEISEVEEQLEAVMLELDASKAEVEKERADRFRAEDENTMLLARLEDSESQRWSYFTTRTKSLQSDLAAAKRSNNFAAALKEVSALVAHFLANLEVRDSARHLGAPHRCLMAELQALHGRLDDSARSFTSLCALLAHRRQMEMELQLRREQVETLAAEKDVDLSQLQVAMEGIYQICLFLRGSPHHASVSSEGLVTTVKGSRSARRSSSKGRFSSSTMPSATAVPESEDSLRVLVSAVATTLSEEVQRWQAAARVWQDLCSGQSSTDPEEGGVTSTSASSLRGPPADSSEVWENGLEQRHWTSSDAESVQIVQDEMQALLALLCKTLTDQLGSLRPASPVSKARQDQRGCTSAPAECSVSISLLSTMSSLQEVCSRCMGGDWRSHVQAAKPASAEAPLSSGAAAAVAEGWLYLVALCDETGSSQVKDAKFRQLASRLLRRSWLPAILSDVHEPSFFAQMHDPPLSLVWASLRVLCVTFPGDLPLLAADSAAHLRRKPDEVSVELQREVFESVCAHLRKACEKFEWPVPEKFFQAVPGLLLGEAGVRENAAFLIVLQLCVVMEASRLHDRCSSESGRLIACVAKAATSTATFCHWAEWMRAELRSAVASDRENLKTQLHASSAEVAVLRRRLQEQTLAQDQMEQNLHDVQRKTSRLSEERKQLLSQHASLTDSLGVAAQEQLTLRRQLNEAEDDAARWRSTADEVMQRCQTAQSEAERLGDVADALRASARLQGEELEEETRQLHAELKAVKEEGAASQQSATLATQKLRRTEQLQSELASQQAMEASERLQHIDQLGNELAAQRTAQADLSFRLFTFEAQEQEARSCEAREASELRAALQAAQSELSQRQREWQSGEEAKLRLQDELQGACEARDAARMSNLRLAKEMVEEVGMWREEAAKAEEERRNLKAELDMEVAANAAARLENQTDGDDESEAASEEWQDSPLRVEQLFDPTAVLVDSLRIGTDVSTPLRRCSKFASTTPGRQRRSKSMSAASEVEAVSEPHAASWVSRLSSVAELSHDFLLARLTLNPNFERAAGGDASRPAATQTTPGLTGQRLELLDEVQPMHRQRSQQTMDRRTRASKAAYFQLVPPPLKRASSSVVA